MVHVDEQGAAARPASSLVGRGRHAAVLCVHGCWVVHAAAVSARRSLCGEGPGARVPALRFRGAARDLTALSRHVAGAGRRVRRRAPQGVLSGQLRSPRARGAGRFASLALPVSSRSGVRLALGDRDTLPVGEGGYAGIPAGVHDERVAVRVVAEGDRDRCPSVSGGAAWRRTCGCLLAGPCGGGTFSSRLSHSAVSPSSHSTWEVTVRAPRSGR